jgi:sortase (surface protein transpeptidase)
MRLPGVLVAALLVLAALASATPPVAGAPGARGLGEQLRYIGRDPATRQPAAVDDRFIAAVERAVERYGRDASEPIPPPPPGPVDVARLRIPSIGVNAAVGRYGVDRFGRLDVPQDATTVGWNPAYTSLPGEGRSTFLAAHYEFDGAPGVFFRLASLGYGADLLVYTSDGREHRYRVVSVVDYPLGAIDMGALLQGREGHESLVLMTCSGPADDGHYPLRTVVIADRVEE